MRRRQHQSHVDTRLPRVLHIAIAGGIIVLGARPSGSEQSRSGCGRVTCSAAVMMGLHLRELSPEQENLRRVVHPEQSDY